jgi:hypothetical protein
MRAIANVTKGLFLLVFWSTILVIAAGVTIYKTTGIGGEIPGVLTDKVMEFVVKSSRASAIPGPVTTVHTEPIIHSTELITRTYVVIKRGDWLSKIAAANHTTVEALVNTKANRERYPSLVKNPSVIHAGWTIVIPPSAATATTIISSPEKSVHAQAEQNDYPERTAKAGTRDNHASSDHAPKHRIVHKKHWDASHSPEHSRQKQPAAGNPDVLRLRMSDRISLIKERYGHIVSDASSKKRVPKDVIFAVMLVESGGYTHAVSETGAQGLMQILPSTQRGLGLRRHEAFDPEKAILAGTQYLRENYEQFQDGKIAILAYYEGAGGAKTWIRSHGNPMKHPYVRAVYAARKHFQEV